jgi:predicted O-linked N-acetylglucosamine transferase (SPINDLY family)
MSADLFANAVKRVIEGKLNITELFGCAEQLKAGGEQKLGVELYKIWLAHNPNDPLLYAIYFNYGVALSESNDLPGAKEALEKAIELNPDFIPPYINLGTLLERMGAVDKAYTQWAAVVNRLAAITGTAVGHKVMAFKQIGRVLERGGIDENAETALRQCLEISPNQNDVIQHYLALRQRQCKWPVVSGWDNVNKATLMGSISPLSNAAYSDDPLFQLASAHHYNKHEVGKGAGSFTAGNWAVPEAPRTGPLRVGYLSSDLREHAVGFLTAGIFELHDRKKVEVFAYYCGVQVPATDATNSRIKKTVDHWVDITSLDDRQAANRILDDRIDILVDLNGNTKDARLKLIAMRPAPIVVNWLGFPGSMGSPYHHYIIADDYIVPEGYELYYSEKVLRLPCYQPNDRKRTHSPVRPTRKDAGLPDDAVVFCCFNGVQKISKPTLERWIQILHRVPKGVLWLLSGAEAVNQRLREYAGQQGIAAERLVFAGPRANPDHVARYPLGDLFLDTWPYGAHTTASDALWMGVPVLTFPGRSFASRVCGSLVRAAGFPELVCSGPEEYVERAVELGNDPAKVQVYKNKIQATKLTSKLFDTPFLVRHLEELYRQMWSEYSSGKLPKPDLSNLEIYQEVGVEEEVNARASYDIEDYHSVYLRKLAYRDSLYPLDFDSRLWTEEVAKRITS